MNKDKIHIDKLYYQYREILEKTKDTYDSTQKWKNFEMLNCIYLGLKSNSISKKFVLWEDIIL